MATSIINSPIRDMWPDGGSPISLSTTPSYLWRDTDAHEVEFYCDVDFRINLAPRIKHLMFYDATDGSFTDGADEAQDGDTSTALTLNSMQTDDYIYVMTEDPIVGLYLDLGDKNDNASVLTINYWKDAATDAWADTTNTDGTDVGGDTFKQDGLNYWTQPSDEITKPDLDGSRLPEGYWYQLSIGAALDSSCTILQAMALSRRSSSQRPTVVMKGNTIHAFSMNREQIAGFQIDVASGVGTLNVNWIRH